VGYLYPQVEIRGYHRIQYTEKLFTLRCFYVSSISAFCTAAILVINKYKRTSVVGAVIFMKVYQIVQTILEETKAHLAAKNIHFLAK
jgi:hypothetical protein